ncbi:MAG: hypothetical protein ONB11_05105 [candidate division KSB1 bacterium]|nr:hypothetical protein [candidate division KSB1 bacterium]
MRPNFSSDDADLSLLSGVYELNFNIPFGDQFSFIGIFPFSTFSAKDEDSESGIGNIYLGLQTRPPAASTNKSSLSFGVFLPTASDELAPVVMGLYSNYYEMQKYIFDLMTIYGNYAFCREQSNVIFSFEVGPNIFIPTKKEREGELFAHYGVFGGVKLNQLILGAELTGLVVISEDVDRFEDRFVHAVGFGIHWRGDNFKPTLFYQIYLDEEYKDVVDGVLGIKLNVIIP